MNVKHHLGNGFFGGWLPQRPDSRDFELDVSAVKDLVPPTFELPGVAAIPCIDQGQQGSCTGHGGAGVLMYDHFKQGDAVVVPSRAMIYYDARIPEGTVNEDSGATIRDMVAGLVKYGACTDQQMPYDQYVFNQAPSQQDYADGKLDVALQYKAVRFPFIDAAIYAGYPVVDGMTVYSSMMTQEVAQTGIVPIPGNGDRVVGGHCTWTFGFNMTEEWWTSPSGLRYPPRTKAKRNSWRNPDGTWWGIGGAFFLPQFFWSRGLVTDCWVIDRVGPQTTNS